MPITSDILLHFFLADGLLELLGFVHDVIVDRNQALVGEDAQGRVGIVVKWVFVLQLSEPLMLLYFGEGKPAVGVSCEDSSQQLLAGGGDVLGNGEFPGYYLFVEGGGVGVLEWKVAAHHGVKDDSARPDICRESFILLAGDHFRGRVARGAACRFEELF